MSALRAEGAYTAVTGLPSRIKGPDKGAGAVVIAAADRGQPPPGLQKAGPVRKTAQIGRPARAVPDFNHVKGVVALPQIRADGAFRMVHRNDRPACAHRVHERAHFRFGIGDKRIFKRRGDAEKVHMPLVVRPLDRRHERHAGDIGQPEVFGEIVVVGKAQKVEPALFGHLP